MSPTKKHSSNGPGRDLTLKDQWFTDLVAPSREAYLAAADKVLEKRGLTNLTGEELLRFLKKPKSRCNI